MARGVGDTPGSSCGTWPLSLQAAAENVAMDSSGSEASILALPEEYERGANLWYSRASRALMRARHPLLASFGRETGGESPHGDELQDERAAADDSARSPLHTEIPVRHEWIVRVQSVVEFDVGTFLVQLTEMSDSAAVQLERGMLEHISSVSDEFGMTVSAADRDLREVLIETLETMDFSFDESGQPNLTLVMHPEMARKLENLNFTPEQ